MKMSNCLRRVAALCLLLGMGLSVSGCIVAPIRGPGWCAYHPYRCR